MKTHVTFSEWVANNDALLGSSWIIDTIMAGGTRLQKARRNISFTPAVVQMIFLYLKNRVAVKLVLVKIKVQPEKKADTIKNVSFILQKMSAVRLGHLFSQAVASNKPTSSHF